MRADVGRDDRCHRLAVAVAVAVAVVVGVAVAVAVAVVVAVVVAVGVEVGKRAGMNLLITHVPYWWLANLSIGLVGDPNQRTTKVWPLGPDEQTILGDGLVVPRMAHTYHGYVTRQR